MSDPLLPPSSPTAASLVFDQSPRRALAALSANDQAAWHLRYCPQEGLEMRARLVLETVERQMREVGQAVTIQALWVELVDRAVESGEPDVRAAAALAAMAMGLRAA